MRLVVIAWLVGCGHDAAPPPAPPSPQPQAPPPADAAAVDHTGWARKPDHSFASIGVEVTYTCGERRLWVDLRRSRIVVDDRGTTSSRALTAAQVAAVQADVEHVLAGGPYEPERTGTPCELALTGTGSQDPFFRVRKDRATTQDAVSALIHDIAP